MLVQYNKSNMIGFGDHMIKPGVNDLPAKIVAAMQEDSVHSQKFEDGILEIIEIDGAKKKGKDGKETNAVTRLISSAPKEGAMLAGKTIDMDILEEWLAREKKADNPERKVVRNALRAQIAKIKNIKYREKDAKKYE